MSENKDKHGENSGECVSRYGKIPPIFGTKSPHTQDKVKVREPRQSMCWSKLTYGVIFSEKFKCIITDSGYPAENCTRVSFQIKSRAIELKEKENFFCETKEFQSTPPKN